MGEGADCVGVDVDFEVEGLGGCRDCGWGGGHDGWGSKLETVLVE